MAASGVPPAAVSLDPAPRRVRNAAVPGPSLRRPRGPLAAQPVTLGGRGRDCLGSHAGAMGRGVRGAHIQFCPPPPPPTMALPAIPSRLHLVLSLSGLLEGSSLRAMAFGCRGVSQFIHHRPGTLRLRAVIRSSGCRACPRAWNWDTQQPAACGRGVGLLRAPLRFGQPSARRGLKTRSGIQATPAPPAYRLTPPAHPSRNPLQSNPDF